MECGTRFDEPTPLSTTFPEPADISILRTAILIINLTTEQDRHLEADDYGLLYWERELAFS